MTTTIEGLTVRPVHALLPGGRNGRFEAASGRGAMAGGVGQVTLALVRVVVTRSQALDRQLRCEGGGTRTWSSSRRAAIGAEACAPRRGDRDLAQTPRARRRRPRRGRPRRPRAESSPCARRTHPRRHGAARRDRPRSRLLCRLVVDRWGDEVALSATIGRLDETDRGTALRRPLRRPPAHDAWLPMEGVGTRLGA